MIEECLITNIRPLLDERRERELEDFIGRMTLEELNFIYNATWRIEDSTAPLRLPIFPLGQQDPRCNMLRCLLEQQAERLHERAEELERRKRTLEPEKAPTLEEICGKLPTEQLHQIDLDLAVWLGAKDYLSQAEHAYRDRGVPDQIASIEEYLRRFGISEADRTTAMNDLSRLQREKANAEALRAMVANFQPGSEPKYGAKESAEKIILACKERDKYREDLELFWNLHGQNYQQKNRKRKPAAKKGPEEKDAKKEHISKTEKRRVVQEVVDYLCDHEEQSITKDVCYDFGHILGSREKKQRRDIANVFRKHAEPGKAGTAATRAALAALKYLFESNDVGSWLAKFWETKKKFVK